MSNPDAPNKDQKNTFLSNDIVSLRLSEYFRRFSRNNAAGRNGPGILPPVTNGRGNNYFPERKKEYNQRDSMYSRKTIKTHHYPTFPHEKSFSKDKRFDRKFIRKDLKSSFQAWRKDGEDEWFGKNNETFEDKDRITREKNERNATVVEATIDKSSCTNTSVVNMDLDTDDESPKIADKNLDSTRVVSDEQCARNKNNEIGINEKNNNKANNFNDCIPPLKSPNPVINKRPEKFQEDPQSLPADLVTDENKKTVSDPRSYRTETNPYKNSPLLLKLPEFWRNREKIEDMARRKTKKQNDADRFATLPKKKIINKQSIVCVSNLKLLKKHVDRPDRELLQFCCHVFIKKDECKLNTVDKRKKDDYQFQIDTQKSYLSMMKPKKTESKVKGVTEKETVQPTVAEKKREKKMPRYTNDSDKKNKIDIKKTHQKLAPISTLNKLKAKMNLSVREYHKISKGDETPSKKNMLSLKRKIENRSPVAKKMRKIHDFHHATTKNAGDHKKQSDLISSLFDTPKSDALFSYAQDAQKKSSKIPLKQASTSSESFSIEKIKDIVNDKEYSLSIPECASNSQNFEQMSSEELIKTLSDTIDGIQSPHPGETDRELTVSTEDAIDGAVQDGNTEQNTLENFLSDVSMEEENQINDQTTQEADKKNTNMEIEESSRNDYYSDISMEDSSDSEDNEISIQVRVIENPEVKQEIPEPPITVVDLFGIAPVIKTEEHPEETDGVVGEEQNDTSSVDSEIPPIDGAGLDSAYQQNDVDKNVNVCSNNPTSTHGNVSISASTGAEIGDASRATNAESTRCVEDAPRDVGEQEINRDATLRDDVERESISHCANPKKSPTIQETEKAVSSIVSSDNTRVEEPTRILEAAVSMCVRKIYKKVTASDVNSQEPSINQENIAPAPSILPSVNAREVAALNANAKELKRILEDTASAQSMCVKKNYREPTASSVTSRKGENIVLAPSILPSGNAKEVAAPNTNVEETSRILETSESARSMCVKRNYRETNASSVTYKDLLRNQENIAPAPSILPSGNVLAMPNANLKEPSRIQEPLVSARSICVKKNYREPAAFSVPSKEPSRNQENIAPAPSIFLSGNERPSNLPSVIVQTQSRIQKVTPPQPLNSNSTFSAFATGSLPINKEPTCPNVQMPVLASISNRTRSMSTIDVCNKIYKIMNSYVTMYYRINYVLDTLKAMRGMFDVEQDVTGIGGTTEKLRMIYGSTLLKCLRSLPPTKKNGHLVFLSFMENLTQMIKNPSLQPMMSLFVWELMTVYSESYEENETLRGFKGFIENDLKAQQEIPGRNMNNVQYVRLRSQIWQYLRLITTTGCNPSVQYHNRRGPEPTSHNKLGELFDSIYTKLKTRTSGALAVEMSKQPNVPCNAGNCNVPRHPSQMSNVYNISPIQSLETTMNSFTTPNQQHGRRRNVEQSQVLPNNQAFSCSPNQVICCGEPAKKRQQMSQTTKRNDTSANVEKNNQNVMNPQQNFIAPVAPSVLSMAAPSSHYSVSPTYPPSYPYLSYPSSRNANAMLPPNQTSSGVPTTNSPQDKFSKDSFGSDNTNPVLFKETVPVNNPPASSIQKASPLISSLLSDQRLTSDDSSKGPTVAASPITYPTPPSSNDFPTSDSPISNDVASARRDSFGLYPSPPLSNPSASKSNFEIVETKEDIDIDYHSLDDESEQVCADDQKCTVSPFALRESSLRLKNEGDDIIDLTWLDDDEVKEEPENPNSSSNDSAMESLLIVQNRKCLCGEVAEYLCACNTVMYCSEECQFKDWTNHQRVCPSAITVVS